MGYTLKFTGAELDSRLEKVAGLETALSEATTSVGALSAAVAGKQDAIADLAEIRRGAEKGATAIQKVKTINGQSIEGEGDITIKGGGDTSHLEEIIESNEKVTASALNDLNNKITNLAELETVVNTLSAAIADKQDTIDDLDEIRSGAEKSSQIESELKGLDYEFGKEFTVTQENKTYIYTFLDNLVIGKNYYIKVTCADNNMTGQAIVWHEENTGAEKYYKINEGFVTYIANDTKVRFNLTSGAMSAISSFPITFVVSVYGESRKNFEDIYATKVEVTEELNRTLEGIFTHEYMVFEKGKYKGTNLAIGDQSNLILTSNEILSVGMIELNEDVERIHIRTASRSKATRPYIMLDEQARVVALGDPSVTGKYTEVIFERNEIPRNARYLFVNYLTTDTILSEPFVDVTFRKFEIKPLTGKRIICFGDSITEGMGNYVNGEFKSWADYLPEYFGAEVTNLGVGGSHLTPLSFTTGNSQNGLYVYHLIKAWRTGDFSIVESAMSWAHNHTENYGDRWDHVESTLKNTTPNDYDIVIIAAGTNDWYNADHVLGNITDTDPIRNFSASLRDIIVWLQEMNPNLHILICPPVVRYAGSITDDPLDASLFSDDYKNPNSGLMLEDVSETMRAVAKKLHVQSLDLYNELGWNIHTWKTFANDAVHPNGTGYRAMARYIGSQLVAKNCR